METGDRKLETAERKAIQARQSSDGTFELFVGQGGLEEISEEEISVAEIVPKSSTPIQSQRNTKTIPIVIGVLLTLSLGIGGFFLLSGEKRAEEQPLIQVQGFRAYSGGAKKTKNASKLSRKSPIKRAEKEKAIEKIEEPERNGDEEDNVAWKLTGKEPTPANDVEARIQPNRNPTPESLDVTVAAERAERKGKKDEKVIDDENDDSKEIAAQKRLGFLPVAPTTFKKGALKKIKKLNVDPLTKDLPKFKSLPKVEIPETTPESAPEAN